jgi:ketosteroid isomerase-like protein
MRTIFLSFVVIGLSVPPSRAAAQEPSSSLAASLQQFRDSWREAWNRRDTKALGALIAEDVDWIAADGTWLKGRKAWQEHHDRLFAGQFKAARWKLLDESADFRLANGHHHQRHPD